LFVCLSFITIGWCTYELLVVGQVRGLTCEEVAVGESVKVAGANSEVRPQTQVREEGDLRAQPDVVWWMTGVCDESM
jgi:hypothetical protein